MPVIICEIYMVYVSSPLFFLLRRISIVHFRSRRNTKTSRDGYLEASRDMVRNRRGETGWQTPHTSPERRAEVHHPSFHSAALHARFSLDRLPRKKRLPGDTARFRAASLFSSLQRVFYCILLRGSRIMCCGVPDLCFAQVGESIIQGAMDDTSL